MEAGLGGRPLKVTPTPGPGHVSWMVSSIHMLSLLQVLFLPTSLGKAEETFIIACDNCQIKELVITGGRVAPGTAYRSSIGNGMLCLPQPGAPGPPGPTSLVLSLQVTSFILSLGSLREPSVVHVNHRPHHQAFARLERACL